MESLNNEFISQLVILFLVVRSDFKVRKTATFLYCFELEYAEAEHLARSHGSPIHLLVLG
jgi:hypothetical protein